MTKPTSSALESGRITLEAVDKLSDPNDPLTKALNHNMNEAMKTAKQINDEFDEAEKVTQKFYDNVEAMKLELRKCSEDCAYWNAALPAGIVRTRIKERMLSINKLLEELES